jgi:uncharacterized protein YjbJ (UPF0337 family)
MPLDLKSSPSTSPTHTGRLKKSGGDLRFEQFLCLGLLLRGGGAQQVAFFKKCSVRRGGAFPFHGLSISISHIGFPSFFYTFPQVFHKKGNTSKLQGNCRETKGNCRKHTQGNCRETTGKQRETEGNYMETQGSCRETAGKLQGNTARWRDFFSKEFIDGGTRFRRNSLMEGFLFEGIHRWRDSFSKEFLDGVTFFRRNS